MANASTREVVVEIERVKTVRKRCRTQVLFCYECNAKRDFISLVEAAKLFDVDRSMLLRFIRHHICIVHGNPGDMLLCLYSFLETAQRRCWLDGLRHNSNIRLING